MLLGSRFCSAEVPSQLYICNLDMKIPIQLGIWNGAYCLLKYMHMKRHCLFHPPACPLHLHYN